MKEISINGQLRADYGKKASRDMRRDGLVPCVLYGVETVEEKNEMTGKTFNKPVATTFTVTMKELVKVLYTPNVYIVNINLDGKTVKAIVKDLQCDYVTDRPIHVDFYQITENKPVVMEIPVKLNGLADGVTAGGKLVLNVRKLKVKGLYTNFPDTLDIDVTSLGLGKSMKVATLAYDNIEIMTSKEVVVCAVRMTRAARAAAAQEAVAKGKK